MTHRVEDAVTDEVFEEFGLDSPVTDSSYSLRSKRTREGGRTGGDPAVAVAFVGATIVAVAAAILLHRLLFSATAQSFDTMIYARGLWGLAHLDWTNPVLGVPTLAVHAHGLLVLLAPLARIFDATALLVVAQAVAVGAAVFVAARAAASEFDGRWSRPLVALGACLALVPASPWLANPVLFDARPDLAGVPLALLALIRARAVGRFDRLALLFAWGAIAMREEFALLTLAPAVALAPLPGMTWRSRIATALPMLVYWAVYWFVLRDLLGQQSRTVEIGSYSRLWLSLPPSTTWPEIAGYKLELVATAAATGGGLALLGGRWVVAAALPVAFVLVTHRLQSLQLNFHYPIFAAPLLIVAALEGLRRCRSRAIAGGHTAVVARTVLIAATATAVATAAFLGSSAWPGGGRWRAPYFAVGAVSEGRHAVVASLDPDVGVAVPYEVGAPVADRPVVWTTIRLARHLREGHEMPAEIDVVVVSRADLADLGSRVSDAFDDPGQPIAPSDLTVYRRHPDSTPRSR